VADDSPTARTDARPRFRFGAWQPLTGGGIAAFAHSGFARLLAFQLGGAALAAFVVVVALRATLFPVVDAAVQRLPEQATIRNGRLDWPESAAVRLAENAWFDVVVTPAGTEPLGQTADLQLDLRPDRARLEGALGHLDLPWPRGLELDLGRIPATASWGAWRGAGQAIVAGSLFVALIAAWWILATLLLLPGWLGSLLLGRSIGIGGLWRMAGASLLVGSAVAILGLAGYATRRWQLTGLIASQAIHVVVGWLWFAWGIVATPRGGGSSPFAPAADRPGQPAGKRKKGRNPFGS